MRRGTSLSRMSARPTSAVRVARRAAAPVARHGGATAAHAAVLDMQQAVGNTAVAAAIDAVRAGGPPPGVMRAGAPPPFRPIADFDTIKLRELDQYATDRVDWSTDTALPPARRQSLVDVLEFARFGEKPPLGPMGEMTVKDVEATTLTPDVRTKFRSYAKGVRSQESAAIPRTPVVADAQRDGEALATLEAGIPPATLHHVMGTTDEGKAEFPALVKDKKVDKLVAYIAASHAYLEADNGADVLSYREAKRDPIDFVGKLPRVHNYHRFEAELLDQLITNEGDNSRARPLALILHSGSDHNGAFRLDHELTNLVTHKRNLTLMVEGAVSLEALGGEADQIAKDYGQGGKIDQLMIAGHGAPEGMEMAGAMNPKGQFPDSQALDTKKNKKRTEKFIKGLVKNMATGPDSRVVLNACLTAADTLPDKDKLSADPAKARKQIKDQLAKQPSIAPLIQKLVPGGVTVEGNVSSVSAGEYMAKDAMGNPTGVMHQDIPSDKYATSSDRGDYVEFGEEPEGAMRAVVMLWALDKVKMLARLELRRGKKVGAWQDQVIHVFYDLVHGSPDNAAMMNRLAQLAARGLSEFDSASEQKPPSLYGLSWLPKAELDAVATPLHPLVANPGKMAMDQIWMLQNNTRQATFMAELDAFADTTAANPHLDMGVLKGVMGSLLPIASAAAPSKAQAKLALWAVTAGGGNPSAEAFLKANAGATKHLTLSGGDTVDGLTGGAATENDVLTTLGLIGGGGGGGGGGGPAPNYDTDKDGTPDVYVESITRRGAVAATWLNVRDRPSMTAPVTAIIPKKYKVEVVGQSGQWYAIEHGGSLAFVHKSWVKLVKPD